MVSRSTERAPRRQDDVVRITDAPVGTRQHQQHRMGAYLWSMGIRSACFVGLIFTHGVVQWVLVAAAVLLPYISVVLANAGRESQPPPGTEVTPQARAPLDPGPLPGERYTWSDPDGGRSDAGRTEEPGSPAGEHGRRRGPVHH